MTTPRPHSDTEPRPTGLDGRIEDVVDWIGHHRRALGIGLGAIVALWVALALWGQASDTRREEASAELAAVEAAFAAEMGAQPGDALIPEPANAEQARKARETALAKFEALAKAHENTQIARHANLRSAELEVDLARLDAADARLIALIAELGDRDPLKGIALRLRGYVLEELGRDAEAAAVYEAGGALASYPPRAMLWLAASRTHARIGANAQALAALDHAIAADPDLVSDPAIERERKLLQAAAAKP
jgi:hypothetical protein